MNELFPLFLEIAKGLNTSFGIKPCLYGSVGLQLHLPETDLHPDDIDILLPYNYLNEQFKNLAGFMAARDFELVDLHEHTFERNGVKVSFAVNDLYDYARINNSELPVIEEYGVSFYLPSMSQFLIIYETSIKDSYRGNKNNGKDKIKICLIKVKMEKSHEHHH